MLAIICEVQCGHITSTQVKIDERLLARYHGLYEIVAGDRQSANPHLPLWHLRNDQGPAGPLWAPDLANGIGALSEQLGQPKSLRQLYERFTSAHIDVTLFQAVLDEQVARKACTLLVTYYFSDQPEALQTLNGYLDRAIRSGEYERNPGLLAGSVKEERQQYARSAAFRSLVLEAYDYRCAASRLRYITPDYRYLVEAAHLIPFAVSQDDRPTNGLALTPNLHWAMDNHLIAPGPDHNWHVSPAVDALVLDNSWLCELDGCPLALPRDSKWHPSIDALEWRLDNLLR